MKYVALLRGINVGGNNKVDMGQLVAAMEKEGFQGVSTYINSGNIFFSSDQASVKLVKQLESVIQSEFELSIKILLRNKKNIGQVVSAIPAEWKNGTDMKCDVMFLWEEYNDKEVLDRLDIRQGIDDVRYVEGAIIWKVDRKNVTRSGMAKLVGTELYKHMTIRNCNTVRKIEERMSL